MKYYCPIIIKDAKFKKFTLSKDVILRLTKKQLREFFGIEEIQYTFIRIMSWVALSKIKPAKVNGRCPYSGIVKKGIYDGAHDVLASNYVAHVASDKDYHRVFERVNLSFKLCIPTSTGISLFFREKEIDVGLFNQMFTLNGPFDYLSINKKDLFQIKYIFSLFAKRKKDKKLNLITSLYRRALLGDKSLLDVRFLLLTATLESLYLPLQNQELSYRLQFRMSKLLSGYMRKDPFELSKIIKKIYKVRSKIIHTGESNELEKDSSLFIELVNLVRVSIILYIYDKNLFSDDYLDRICLLGHSRRIIKPKTLDLLLNRF